MNKITVTKEEYIELKDNAVDLDINVPKLTLNVKGKVLINELSIKENENTELTINVEPQSSLVYNRFLIHNIMNNKITINQEHLSSVIFNYSFIAKDKCHLTIDTNLNGDDNESEINIKAVTELDGAATIIGTADAKEKIKNNNLIESIKVLVLNNEESVCIPNLLVATNDVIVNHACTISPVDQNELFYLESKGLSKEQATKLIKNGFIVGNLSINEEIRQQILNMIEGE